MASKTDPSGDPDGEDRNPHYLGLPSILGTATDNKAGLSPERGPNPDCRWCKGSGKIVLVSSIVECTDCWSGDQAKPPPTRDDLLRDGTDFGKAIPPPITAPFDLDSDTGLQHNTFLASDEGTDTLRKCPVDGIQKGRVEASTILWEKWYWRCGRCKKMWSKADTR